MKFQYLLTLLVPLIWYACTPDQPNQLESGIYFQYMDSTANPGDDFNQFVNGGWIDNTEIPSDKGSYGISYILHEESEENVKGIIEESASGDFEKGSNEQKVGDLYNSYMDRERRNSLGIQPLADEFERIDAISNYSDLSREFGRGIKIYDVPFSYGIFPDFKVPTEYTIYYFQSGLGLPDREYYLKEDDKSKELRRAYVDHMAKMLGLAGLDNASEAAQSIMDLETQMAEANMRKEDTRNLQMLYNPIPVDSLSVLMPDFDWNAFLDEGNLNNVKKVVIGMTDYSRQLNDIMVNTDLEVWKLYLKWNVINAADTYLNEELDNQNFDFYGKTLRGTQEQRPDWRRAVSLVNSRMGEVVGQVYVKKYFPEAAKSRMEELVGNLIKAYEASIEELDWMSDSTKQQALDKLSKFNPKIGYPDKWTDYSALDIESDDLYGNVVRADMANYQRQIDKLNGPIDKEEWQMSPQTVNAYYNPTLNEIVFPAAILQPPFFDMQAEDAVNYGSIGAVIGHEIGHGFDDSGSQFDGDGQMRNWWTDGDRERFEELTGALISQYNSYQVFDDLNVNGEFTLGENIGDLGGLGIALKAYQMSLKGAEGPVLDGLTAAQRVFIGYAQSWRFKSREETMRIRVNSDPHSPPKFRVNGVVRNIPEWYDAFAVSPENELYLPPEERIKIW